MLTPEKRHGSERRGAAEHIERRSLPLTFGDNPVFDADVLTTMRIGPACDVAGGVDVPFARLEVLIDDNPAVGFETCLLGKLEAGPNSDSYDYEISLERIASFEFHPFAIDGSYRFFEVEEYAVFPVQVANEVAHLRTQNSLHRPLFRRHDMDLELTRAQRGSNLEADEACPDDNYAAC